MRKTILAKKHIKYYNLQRNLKPIPEQWLDYALELVPDKAKLLDVGSGAAHLLKIAKKQKKCEVFGLDVVPHFVKKSKKLGFNVKLCNIEVERVPFDQKFDVIVMAEVIEHLYDPLGVLKKLAKSLKKGGIIVITTPNSFSLRYRFMFMLGYDIFTYQHPLHIRFFSKKSLKNYWNPPDLLLINGNPLVGYLSQIEFSNNLYFLDL